MQRNQTREYVDIAALAERLGVADAAHVLAGIDAFYRDVNSRPEAVATQVARQLADPRPRDIGTTERLAECKGLVERWHEWSAVTTVLADVAAHMVERAT